MFFDIVSVTACLQTAQKLSEPYGCRIITIYLENYYSKIEDGGELPDFLLISSFDYVFIIRPIDYNRLAVTQFIIKKNLMPVFRNVMLLSDTN